VIEVKKECCSVKVRETDNGYCVEIEGDNVKSKCKDLMENCCSSGMMKNWFQPCCPSDK